jgi:hypothetical protein
MVLPYLKGFLYSLCHVMVNVLWFGLGYLLSIFADLV